MRILLEGYEELPDLVLMGINGGACSGSCSYSSGTCSETTSGTCSKTTIGTCAGTDSDDDSTTTTNQEKLNDAITDNLGDAYESSINDCDIWIENIFEQAGVEVTGFENSKNKSCYKHLIDINSENDQATMDVDNLNVGKTYLGVNSTHAFLVTKNYDGTYSVSDHGGSESSPLSETRTFTASEYNNFYGSGGGSVTINGTTIDVDPRSIYAPIEY